MDELKIKFSTSRGSSSQHTIYCKRHSVRQPSTKIPNQRTLFTTGWPPYCGRDSIQELFSRLVGQVEGVYLQEGTKTIENEQPQTGGYMIGYIVFKEDEEVSRALSLCSAGSPPLSCCVGDTGLKKWTREYQERYPVESLLEKAAESGVTAYDEWVESEKKRKKHLSEPDEDGWVTVTKKTPIVEKPKRKKKKPQLLMLYAFQQREKQRERIAELRKKFQEDQQKVAAMRANRKFKPF